MDRGRTIHVGPSDPSSRDERKSKIDSQVFGPFRASRLATALTRRGELSTDERRRRCAVRHVRFRLSVMVPSTVRSAFSVFLAPTRQRVAHLHLLIIRYTTGPKFPKNHLLQLVPRLLAVFMSRQYCQGTPHHEISLQQLAPHFYSLMSSQSISRWVTPFWSFSSYCPPISARQPHPSPLLRPHNWPRPEREPTEGQSCHECQSFGMGWVVDRWSRRRASSPTARCAPHPSPILPPSRPPS
jgi:hypothetical protein